MSVYAEVLPEIKNGSVRVNPITGILESTDPNYVWNNTTQKLEPATTLGNGLTNSQKWAWVIGLSFAAWALLYWSQKKS